MNRYLVTRGADSVFLARVNHAPLLKVRNTAATNATDLYTPLNVIKDTRKMVYAHSHADARNAVFYRPSESHVCAMYFSIDILICYVINYSNYETK